MLWLVSVAVELATACRMATKSGFLKVGLDFFALSMALDVPMILDRVMHSSPKIRKPWCPGPESNRHALRRGILSPLRLPISPPGHFLR